jgi:hypothetical protein
MQGDWPVKREWNELGPAYKKVCIYIPPLPSSQKTNLTRLKISRIIGQPGPAADVWI